MKPTREEILAVVGEIYLNNNSTKLLWDKDANIGKIKNFLESFALAMYRKGQEDMREKAAWEAKRSAYSWTVEAIRAIPIEEEE